MAYTNFSIIPSDGTVYLDGVPAFGVDMTGIGPTVHAVQWYGAVNTGVVEYDANPITGAVPVSTTFSDPSPYADQITEAETIIYADQNPQTYYSTVDNNTVQGFTYNLGDPIVIRTPNTPQPANTTTLAPPTPDAFQQLYWYNNAWVVSSVDPTLTLSDAKSALNKNVANSAAEQAKHQARIYSLLEIITAANPALLEIADYPGVDLGEYQTYLNGAITTLRNTVNAATSVSDLYNVDYRVSGNPTP